MDEIERQFKRYKEAAELQLRFIEVLGGFKLAQARASLLHAVSAGIAQQIRIKRKLVNQLEADLRRMNTIRYRFSQRIKTIETRAKYIAQIRRGQRVHSLQLTRIWGAFHFFEQIASQDALDSIMDTEIQSRSRAASNYAKIRGNQPAADATEGVPSDLENVYELLAWLEAERLVPKVGKPAFRQVTRAFSALASPAADEIAKLNANIEAIEKRTYEYWKPVELLKIGPDLSEVSNILKATA